MVSMFTSTKIKTLSIIILIVAIIVLLGITFLQNPAHSSGASTSPPTSAPTVEITPVAPPALQITYVCNDGFVIAAAGKKILIDALFQDTNGICSIDPPADATQFAQPLFDHADLVLVSHGHWDHFDSQIVGNYLLDNPEANLIAEKSAADALREEFSSFDLLAERVHSVELPRGQSTQLKLAGISVELISSPADVPNLGFLFQLGEFTFFHSGDANFDGKMVADLQANGTPARGINFAFVPYWYMTDSMSKTLLDEGIHADHYIPMHYAGEGGEWLFTVISKVYPQAIIFPKELQTWSDPTE
jgi:L-ascorbate metabolism protein UlaG (beta-lactamase superfamily)